MSNDVNDKFKTKKATFQLTNESLDKLDSFCSRVGINKSKVLEVMLKKFETNTFKDEFEFYNIKIKNENK